MLHRYTVIIFCLFVLQSISLKLTMSSSSSSSSTTISIPEDLKCILWDVDGTLSDSFQLGFSSTRVVLNNNGIKDITEEDYHLGTKYVIISSSF